LVNKKKEWVHTHTCEVAEEMKRNGNWAWMEIFGPRTAAILLEERR
jgi:hypothetical protein